MTDFFRRYLTSSLMLHSPDEGGAPEAPDAGGDGVQPAPQDPPSDAGTAEGGATDPGASPPPASASADGAPPATPAPAPDRAQQRMNQLVAERWAERRRAEEAEARGRLLQEQLDQTRAAAAPQVDANGQPQVSTRPAAPAPNLQEMAAQIAAQNDFNRQVADEVARGRDPAKGGHVDFDQVAGNLQRFGELPRTFVEAALATGKGAEVMYHLGSDIAEADRILSMPPIQQAVALATLAQSIKSTPAKTVTSAPNPVTPKVGGGKTTNTPSLEDENMSTEAWIALREKQLAAKKTDQRAARR
jgi:hypothetical protein